MRNKFRLILIICIAAIGLNAQTITENEDKLGLKNSSGEVILEPKYDEVVRYRTFCRYTPVYSYALNGKHGIICHPDSTGYTDSGLIYDSVYYFHNCIVILKAGKLGIVNELRNNIFRCGTPRYDSIVPMFGNWNPEDGNGIKHFYDYITRELQVRIGHFWGIADYHSDSLLVSPRWNHPLFLKDGVWVERIVRDSDLAVIILPRTGTEIRTSWMFEACYNTERTFLAVYPALFTDGPELTIQVWDARTGFMAAGYHSHASDIRIEYCGGTTVVIKEKFKEYKEWGTKDETKYTFMNYTNGYILFEHICVKEEQIRWSNDEGKISVFSRKHYNAYTEKLETTFSAF
ncbi:MAG: hypothetical protein RL007_564 [Bacteroidota bacterium]|jgi:hypothetical protein